MKRLWFAFVAVLAGALVWNAAAMSEEEKPNPGKELFLGNKCNSCHMVSAQGIEKRSAEAADEAKGEKAENAEKSDDAPAAEAKGKKYPDLSGVGLTRDAEWLGKYLMKLEAKDGKKHIKKFKGTDAELATLSGWLASLKDEVKAEEGAKSEEAPKAEETPKSE